MGVEVMIYAYSKGEGTIARFPMKIDSWVSTESSMLVVLFITGMSMLIVLMAFSGLRARSSWYPFNHLPMTDRVNV